MIPPAREPLRYRAARLAAMREQGMSIGKIAIQENLCTRRVQTILAADPDYAATHKQTDPWDDEKIARLRTLWAEGHSITEIGRRVGLSRNAVVGKAHRLDLPARPSPIIREQQEEAKP